MPSFTHPGLGKAPLLPLSRASYSAELPEQTQVSLTSFGASKLAIKEAPFHLCGAAILSPKAALLCFACDDKISLGNSPTRVAWLKWFFLACSAPIGAQRIV